MAAEADLGAAIQAADLKSLELLFDYTKFHIGLYLTLGTSFIAVASLKRGESFVLPVTRWLAMIAIFFFMLAGLAGGVIVSEITQCYGIPKPERGKSTSQQAATRQGCASTREFLGQKMGPGSGKWIRMRGKQWIHIEHTSFWIGLLLAFGSFIRLRRMDMDPKQPLAVQVQGSIQIDNGFRNPRDAAGV